MSMKTLLVAMRPMRYNTRRLLAGDTFEARNSDAKLLVALGRATESRDKVELDQIPQKLAERVKPQESLLGSSILEANYSIGGENVQLGKIVALAHANSGLSVGQWNMLPTDQRETMLREQLETLQAAANVPQGDDTQESGNSASTTSASSPLSGEGLTPSNNNSGSDIKVDDKGKITDLGDGSKLISPPVEEKPVASAAATTEDLATARDRYHKVVGRRAYAGWDLEQVQAKIAEFEASRK